MAGIVGFMGQLADEETMEEIIIRRCINRGDITAVYQQAGGIVGACFSPTCRIEKCTNEGNILVLDHKDEGLTSSGLGAGGIIGRIAGPAIVKDCVNTGEVIAGTQKAGGIVGTSEDDDTIEDCRNEGTVIVKSNHNFNTETGIICGGVAGYITGNTAITNCNNIGNITAERQQVGGIVGTQAGGTVHNCYNEGRIVSNSVDGHGITGGIVGVQNSGNIEKVYNTGEIVTGNFADEIDYSGGIVGWQYDGSLTLAYNRGDLSDTDAIGGIVGLKRPTATVEKTFYYTEKEIKGIASESDNTDSLFPVEDTEGKVEKVAEKIETFEKFLQWIESKV